MISAGKMDQRINIQRPSRTKNAAGDSVESWVLVAAVWAEALPLRGQTLFVANQEQHQVDVRFRIRARSGIDESMRIQWAGKHYDITTIIPGSGPYKGITEIVAVTGVKDGR